MYSEKDEAWEREFQREKLALVREQEAQAREEKLKRTLARIRAEALAVHKVARRASAAKSSSKVPGKRGPKGYADVKEWVLEEAGRRRDTGKQVTAPIMLVRAGKKFGHNSIPQIRAFRRWLSTKRS